MIRQLYRCAWIPLLLMMVTQGLAATHAVPVFQQRVITGKVTTPEKEDLPGVNIVIKGTTVGTVTDAFGAYSISVPNDEAVLVFSFIGFAEQQVVVGSRSAINIVLEPSTESLSEVVVIGYGEVRKSDLTGSVSSVKAAELKAVPTTSFDQALQGRAAGVQVSQTSGQPGAEASIRIRGISSITAGNEPLYVIDGMLVNSNSGDVTPGGVAGPRIGPLSAINPNDIESIEILKDASATAIYGSRGANGVILITTKRGKQGTSTVDFEAYYGVQEVSKKLDLLNASQFGSFVNEARINAGQQPAYVNPQNLGKGTDWQDEIFRTAPIQSYQLSFTGGSERTQYAISGGLFDQDGVVINTGFKRYSFRTNITTQVNNRMSVGTNFTVARTSGTTANTGLQFIGPGMIGAALTMNPILPVHDPSERGGYTYENVIGGGPVVVGSVAANPVAELMDTDVLSTSSRAIGSIYGTYRILDGLVFKTSLGIDAVVARDRSFQPSWLKASRSVNGIAGVSTMEALTWLNENTLTYDKKVREKDHLNVLVGFTSQEFENESLSSLVFGASDQLGYNRLSLGSDPQAPSNGQSRWSMISYLGRAQYSMNNKYLLTLTGRIDGSSKFSADNKYSFFPSAAAAWRISEEPFMDNVTFLTDLKIKGSVGIIGNQAIGPYASLPLVASYGQGVFNNGPNSVSYTSSQPQSYNNPGLKWETTRTINAGFDAAVFEGRLQLTAEYYQKYTYDLLLSTPVSSTTGFVTTLLNVGNVENNGIDLEITSINTAATRALQWNTSLNFSTVRNTVTRLATDNDVQLGSGLILREGESIGTFYGYQFDGIFQSDAEASASAVFTNQKSGAGMARAGDRKYRDIVEDGVINEQDRTIIGNALPDFTWGLNNTLSYKNLTLSFFIQGSQGNDMINLNQWFLEDMTATHNVSAEAWENRWTPENPSNEFPRVLANRTTDVGTISSKFIEDASYVRLKNITLGYNLPASILQSVRMRSCRLYASATNVLTLTGYKGYDPEGSSHGTATAYPGVDQGRYPLTKTYTFGLNIGF